MTAHPQFIVNDVNRNRTSKETLDWALALIAWNNGEDFDREALQSRESVDLLEAAVVLRESLRATHEPGAGPLSMRVRPNSEAAPWVVEEIKKLEAQLAALPPFPDGLHDITEALDARGDELSVRAARYIRLKLHMLAGRESEIRHMAVSSETKQPQPPLADDGCICKGDWRLIVKEVEHLINTQFIDSRGDKFNFFGIVHGGDDYYYGMSSPVGVRLLSSVGSIEGHGYSIASSEAMIDIDRTSKELVALVQGTAIPAGLTFETFFALVRETNWNPTPDELRELLKDAKPMPPLGDSVRAVQPPHSDRHLREFTEWLTKEMPAGTVIGDPVWWARKLLAAACVFAEKAPSTPPPAVTLTSQERHALFIGAQEARDPTCVKLLLELYDRSALTKEVRPRVPPYRPQRDDFMECGVVDDAAYEAAMRRYRAASGEGEGL